MRLSLEDRKLVTRRTSDGTAIASVPVRDPTQLVGAHWDCAAGRYLSLVFTDGSVRVHDAHLGGKLVALVRAARPLGPVDAACWGRVWEPAARRGAVATDVTRQMPLLVKFRAASAEGAAPPLGGLGHPVHFAPGPAEWRRGLGRGTGPGSAANTGTQEQDPQTRRLLDVHVLHSPASDEVHCVLNGAFDVLLHGGGVPPGPDMRVLRVLPLGGGEFQLWYVSGHARTLSVRGITHGGGHMALLAGVDELVSLAAYLRQHMDLLQTHVVVPYVQLLTTLVYEGRDTDVLWRDIRQMYLMGTRTDALGDWLHLTLGERNLAEWGALFLRTITDVGNVLSLGFIPALERVVVLAERFHGDVRAYELRELYIGEVGSSHAVLESVRRIVSACQRLLRECTDTMQRNAAARPDMETLATFLQVYVKTETLARRAAEDADGEDSPNEYEYDATIEESEVLCEPGAGTRMLRMVDALLGPGNDIGTQTFPSAVFAKEVDTIAAEVKSVQDAHVRPRLQRALEAGTQDSLRLCSEVCDAFPGELGARLQLLDVALWPAQPQGESAHPHDNYTAALFVDSAARDTAHLYLVVGWRLGQHQREGRKPVVLHLDFAHYGPQPAPLETARLELPASATASPTGAPAVVATTTAAGAGAAAEQRVHLVLHTAGVHAGAATATAHPNSPPSDRPAGSRAPELRAIEQILQ